MKARKFSPNWYWAEVGAIIHRDKKRHVTVRTITLGGRVLSCGAPREYEEKLARRVYKLFKKHGRLF